MKSSRALAAAALTLAALGGLAPVPAFAGPAHAQDPASWRGELVGDPVPLDTLTADQVRSVLSGDGRADGHIDPATVRYGVTTYRLTYRTLTPQGTPTAATGLLVLPETGGHRRLDLVSDTHGTMVKRSYAPSAGEEFGRLSPLVQGSAGRAVAAPDYLGLGEGPGLHPYMDTASGVSASLDMLRAARTAAYALGRPVGHDVYATGFSQGGQVAMALAKQLDQGVDKRFRLKAVAPVSGPYDIEHTEMPALFDGRVNDVSGVFYLSYWLVAQNRLHPLYKSPEDAFREPYASRVESLFDGEHEEDAVVASLAPSVRELLTPAFYERLRHPDGGLLAAMKAADGTCDWKPAVPVRLYTATGDTDVPIANTRACARQFAAHGVRARVVDQGAVGHNGAFMKSAPETVRFFDSVARHGRG
ncbi:alpha/beta hydrolase [Streptomyces sp. NPDC059070]|uniref:alpha/beta hydrolase n=1 Tax=Streptomyces sp. NPDC059070 TaxID=3346713 RepID=UPI0036A42D1E